MSANRFWPFLLMGVAIVAFIFGIILLAYLFLFGAIVGFVLFLVNWIKLKLYSSKAITPKKKDQGRIIDTDDWKKL